MPFPTPPSDAPTAPPPLAATTPSKEPSRRPSPVPLLAGLLTMIALFVGLYFFFVRTATGQWLDEQAFLGGFAVVGPANARSAGLGWLNRLPEAVGVLCAVGLVVCAWVRRSLAVPAVAALTAAAAMIATQLLKHGVLDRPGLGVSEAWANSFPSGHTTAAAAATVALVLAAPARARRTVTVLGALASAATGAATLLMGWHRPSDIAAAFLVSGACGLLGAWVIASLNARRPVPPRRRPAHGMWILSILGAGLCLVSLAFALTRLGPVALDAQDPTAFFVAGLLAILGSALLVFPALERLASPRL